MSTDSVNRHRLVSSADLIRKGATLLGEACPRCGGVQLRYQNKTYCLNEDNLDLLLAPSGVAMGRSSETNPETQQDWEKREHGIQKESTTAAIDGLLKVLHEKLDKLSKQLESTEDMEQQQKILELISRYADTLNKLEKKM